MKYTVLFVLFQCCILINAYSQSSIRIGWIQDGLEANEKQALTDFFAKNDDFTVVPLTMSKVTGGEFLNQKLTHLFYHQPVEANFNVNGDAAKTNIRNFVDKGGNLILSMEATKLLYDWGYEDRPLQVQADTVKDDGFGIPLGFHAFKSHPVFEGLFGGAVTWKSPQGNIVRRHGFFDKNINPNGQVVGIDWSYITFHHDSKILLEYHSGKGKVLAVGAYMYFSKPNLNQLQLEHFTTNLFRYTAGLISGVEANYWNQVANAGPLSFPEALAGQSIPPAKNWSLPEPSLALKTTQKEDFFDLSGRRMTIMGTAFNGIREIWAHPFMALKEYEVGIRDIKGGIFWLNRLNPEVTITPEAVIREFRFETFAFKEVITVSPDKPIAVLHYESTRNLPIQLVFRLSSNLRYMWPYAIQDSRTAGNVFSPDLNAVVFSAQDNDICTLVGFSEPVKDITQNPAGNVPFTANPDDKVGMYEVTLDPQKGSVDLRIAAGSEGVDKVVDLYKKSLPGFENIINEANTYYKNLLDKSLIIESPDPAFNEGYKWALVKTDQLMINTPGVGTSIMAGFGTTDQGWDGNQTPSGRPGYAWYFGRDGEWCGLAMAAYGDFKSVREILEMLVKYQDTNGKIFHELTSSGVVHYDAADATPLFVVLAGQYLRYSGDTDFIKRIWPNILEAVNYCLGTDTDEDGWIENTGSGHGWVEGGKLFGVHTEFYLAGCWVAALEQAAYIAATIGDGNNATFTQMAAELKIALSKDFWNPRSDFFYHGKKKDGTFMEDATVLAAVPVYLNAVTDPGQIEKVADKFAGSDFTADWGVRMIGKSYPNYFAQGYHSGSVWPLFGGWAALAEYKAGKVSNAFDHIQRNLLNYRHWGPGSIEEVLDGDTYTPKGVCHHQGWSETMVLLPAIEGMLGLQPDAANKTLNMTLRLPWHWNTVKLKHLRVGEVVFDINIDRIETKTFYTFIAQGNPQLRINLNLQFAPGSVPVEIESHFQPTSLEESNEGTSMLLPNIPLKSGETIAVDCNGGIGIIPTYEGSIPGSSSEGFRFIAQAVNIDEGWYTATFEGAPGKSYRTKMFIQNGYKNMENATFVRQDGNVYELEVVMNEQGKQVVKVEF